MSKNDPLWDSRDSIHPSDTFEVSLPVAPSRTEKEEAWFGEKLAELGEVIGRLEQERRRETEPLPGPEGERRRE